MGAARRIFIDDKCDGCGKSRVLGVIYGQGPVLCLECIRAGVGVAVELEEAKRGLQVKHGETVLLRVVRVNAAVLVIDGEPGTEDFREAISCALGSLIGNDEFTKGEQLVAAALVSRLRHWDQEVGSEEEKSSRMYDQRAPKIFLLALTRDHVELVREIFSAHVEGRPWSCIGHEDPDRQQLSQMVQVLGHALLSSPVRA